MLRSVILDILSAADQHSNPLSLTRRQGLSQQFLLIAKATQAFTAISNSAKTVHLYCLIISWLTLILFNIYIYNTPVASIQTKKSIEPFFRNCRPHSSLVYGKFQIKILWSNDCVVMRSYIWSVCLAREVFKSGLYMRVSPHYKWSEFLSSDVSFSPEKYL